MRLRFWPAWGVLFIGFLSANALSSADFEPVQLQQIQQILKVPDSLALVTDAYWPDPQKPPDYFLVQDVHREPSVQSQIATLIEKGYKQWGVKKIFMEGAYTGVDLSVFHRVPTKTQSYLLEQLVKDGHLSGAELAAIHIMEREWGDPPVSPFQLFGLENPKLYQENVMAFQSVVAQRDRALEALVPIRRLQETIHLPQPNAMMEQLDRTEALLRLKLTSTEYKAYLKGKAMVPSTPILDPAIRAAETFYQLAEERSQVFLDNAAKKVPASAAPRLLVVGGFHTAYMTAHLRDAGRTFVVLSPAVSASAEDDPYEKNLMETANAMTEALSTTTH
jgi:hypothetical protein